MKLFFLTIFSCFLFSFSLVGQGTNDVQSIVQAERNFCERAIKKGTKEAFLSVLAEESILFRPQPVNGRKWTMKSPESPGLLSWEPEWAEVAEAGDLGYTTGPFEFRPNKIDSTSGNFGHYVSIWQRQADDIWKLMMDVGISHKKSENEIQLRFPSEKQKVKLPSIPTQQAKDDLLKNDKLFASQIKEKGLIKAYTDFLIPEARLYRNGHFPFVGISFIQHYFSDKEGTMDTELIQAFVAKNADMGYTYGSSVYREENSVPQYTNYIRIWKRQKDNSWKIILDIHTQRPTPKSE